MRERLTATDYNLDWALKEYNVCDPPGPGTLTRQEVLAYCGGLQVGGLELMHEYWRDLSSPEVLEMAGGADLRISTLIFSCDLAVPPQNRHGSLDQAKRCIDRAVSLGAWLAMIVPGTVKSVHPIEEQRLWMIEGLARCSEHAGRSGLKLASENIDVPSCRPLMGRVEQCVDICRRIDSPHYGLIFDPGCAWLAGEDPLDVLDQMMPHLVHVHLKNLIPAAPDQRWHRTNTDHRGQDYRGVRIEEGAIDLLGVLKTLRKRNYLGDFLIEYQGEDEPCRATRDCVNQAEALLAAAGFAQ